MSSTRCGGPTGPSPVTNESDVSALAGKVVRLRFTMRDAKLYALQFVE